MILEYHRAQSLEDALALLARPGAPTFPLAGGTVITQPGQGPMAVVDLQDLGLDQISDQGNTLRIGAMVTLTQLGDTISGNHTLLDVIRREAGYNLRQAATIAGTLVAADGRSPFATSILALNAELSIEPGSEITPLGEILPVRREVLPGKLITDVTIPTNATLVFEAVARSPADQPIVAAAVALWPSGRTRVALGGYGAYPVVAFDGPESGGAPEAARNAYSHASDAWATAEYRQEVAEILVRRAVESAALRREGAAP